MRVTPDSGFVSFNCVAAKPIVYCCIILPAFDGVVVAGRKEEVLLRMPLEALNVLGVPACHGHHVEVEVFAHFPDPHGLVPAAGGEVLAVVVVGGALDLVLVAFQLLNALEPVISQTPDARRPVETGSS